MYLYENTVYVFCVEFCHAYLGKSNVQVSANQIYQYYIRSLCQLLLMSHSEIMFYLFSRVWIPKF